MLLDQSSECHAASNIGVTGLDPILVVRTERQEGGKASPCLSILRFDTLRKEKKHVQNQHSSSIIGLIWVKSPCLNDFLYNNTDNLKTHRHLPIDDDLFRKAHFDRIGLQSCLFSSTNKCWFWRLEEMERFLLDYWHSNANLMTVTFHLYPQRYAILLLKGKIFGACSI